MTQYGKYPDSYYRVAVKAVIRNKRGDVLLVKEQSDDWDLPGGGMDHGETTKVAMARELGEEIDYHGELSMEYVDAIPIFVKKLDASMILMVFSVTLLDDYVPRNGDATSEVAFKNPQEFKEGLTRMEELIYKFTSDPAREIPFI